jgi:nicotinate-nucleotide pyrophosphorylase (carboxylating)
MEAKRTRARYDPPMREANQMNLEALYHHLAAGGLVRRLLDLARDEDLGEGSAAGDITSLVCIAEDSWSSAGFVARQEGIAAGLAALPAVLEAFRSTAVLEVHVADGQRFAAGSRLATLRGPTRDLLAIERTALNLLSRLTGVATTTARYVDAAGGTAKIFDTRKTMPGLRLLEKYAVRCGGGYCHRMGLHDAVLIKDNHISGVLLNDLAAVVGEASRRARAARPELLFVEVEVDSLEQFEVLLRLPSGLIDIVLLDNMPPERLARAVAMRGQAAPSLRLEASGGVRLETIRQIAASGVDRISVGALTHSAVAVDIGLDFDAIPAGPGM